MRRWYVGAAVVACLGIGCFSPSGADPAAGTESSGSSSGSSLTVDPSTSSSTSASTTLPDPTAPTSSESTSGGEETGSSGSIGSGESGESSTGTVDPVWQAFLDERQGYLEALGVPILDCVDNVDTSHHAFHGCIDWHSAVHATYSLHVLYRATDDRQYLDAANATLDPVSVAGELADIQAAALPAIEMPYGYAWFLALAIERERASGQTDLQPHALEVASQLKAWLDSRTQLQLQSGILNDAYGNISWAVVNLWHWAQWSGDAALAADLEVFVSSVLMAPTYDVSCPLTDDATDIDEFFPACLHRAMAITTVAPEGTSEWLDSFLPDDFQLTPLGPVEIQAPHQGGINFSRAFGLWAIYASTDDTLWRDLYIEHIETHVMQPQFWAENYWWYSHWVAQFGVYAIARTYE